MDAKLTLHFNSDVIEQAKEFAAKNNISLSRLTEFLYKKITSENYKNLEELPLADWVMQVAEGQAEYKRRSRKDVKDEYYKSRK